jgi:hypothetical protein
MYWGDESTRRHAPPRRAEVRRWEQDAADVSSQIWAKASHFVPRQSLCSPLSHTVPCCGHASLSSGSRLSLLPMGAGPGPPCLYPPPHWLFMSRKQSCRAYEAKKEKEKKNAINAPVRTEGWEDAMFKAPGGNILDVRSPSEFEEVSHITLLAPQDTCRVRFCWLTTD